MPIESLNQNIKSIETTKSQEINQLETEKFEVNSERSKEISELKKDNSDLRNENIHLKMEVKFYRTVMNLVQRTSPTSILYS